MVDNTSIKPSCYPIETNSAVKASLISSRETFYASALRIIEESRDRYGPHVSNPFISDLLNIGKENSAISGQILSSERYLKYVTVDKIKSDRVICDSLHSIPPSALIYSSPKGLFFEFTTLDIEVNRNSCFFLGKTAFSLTFDIRD
jgi:hypothetical protein